MSFFYFCNNANNLYLRQYLQSKKVKLTWIHRHHPEDWKKPHLTHNSYNFGKNSLESFGIL